MRPESRLGRALVAGAALLPFGLYSLWLGQDANWDQRNYHVYNAYALLRGRMDYDVAPAGPQTFLPQLYNVPFFWLARAAPPRLTGFVLGLVHGLNALLVYAIARRLLEGTRAATALAVLLAAVGVSSPATMSELGTSFGDNVTGLFVLGGVLVLVRRMDDADVRRWALASGALLGVGVGLKYTNGFYGIAMACAVGWLALYRRLPRLALPWLVAGLGLGFVAASGPSAWSLWQRYGNPFLPYFNGVFRSPWWSPTNYYDYRWVPTSLLEGLTYPFLFLVGGRRTLERPFSDPRWALLVVLGVGWSLRVVAARLRGTSMPATGSARDALVALFAAIAFAVWTFTSGYHRYLVPLEILSGVLLLIAVRGAFPSGGVQRVALVTTCVIAVAGTTVPTWERRPWGASWFGIHVDGYVPSDAIVLLSHRHPTAYVVPFFPRPVRFVKLMGENRFGERLEERIDALLAAHSGPLRLLVKDGVTDYERQLLARRDLEVAERCVRVRSHLESADALSLCVVRRRGEPRPPAHRRERRVRPTQRAAGAPAVRPGPPASSTAISHGRPRRPWRRSPRGSPCPRRTWRVQRARRARATSRPDSGRARAA